ncbi:hypothetical protein F4821DRAFT_274258 [Hypoxylon rubiginosum]|uniref:Uncharacterized protein n=1 Tax=Hypoxylon rubiginosum TaxID=110542 RepID=A0ACC0DMB8_9PEZI|nr:hypothetical protein F4821DRAFT_274258 [Hypoxylon rubiginosum]
MAHTVRDGLYEAHRALEALIEDPQRLDRARERFSKSPLYRSGVSQDSTQFHSPEPISEEQTQREKQEWQLITEHRASMPYNQLDAQCQEEEQRILKRTDNTTGAILVDKRRLPNAKVCKLARETVEKRWVEQGIWSDRWKDARVWKWKHEEPPELE